jgi:hypothetical protein
LAPKLPGEIAHVVTGGWWTDSADADGRFRIVVVSGGWEHVSSRVYLDWLRADEDSLGLVLQTQVLVSEIEEGVWVVGPPTLSCEGGRCEASLIGTNTYTQEKRGWRLELYGPGRYRTHLISK